MTDAEVRATLIDISHRVSIVYAEAEPSSATADLALIIADLVRLLIDITD